MQLLFRPRIKEEESLLGYIERLALLNHYNNSLGIFNLLKSSNRDLQNNLFQIKDTVILEELTDESSDLLFSRSFVKINITKKIYGKYILKNKIKYCAQCVKENRIHKFIWGFHPICACLQHLSILRDCCPECSRGLTLNELLQMGICRNCGFQLLSTKVSENDFELSDEYIHSQILIDKSLLEGAPVFKEIGLNEVAQFFSLAEISFHILEGMQSFIDEIPLLISSFSNKRNGNFDNQKSLISWGNYVWMYEDFPTNYYRVLNEFLKKDKKTIYEQKNKYEEGLIKNEFSVIKDAYEQFWILKLDEGIIRKDFSVFKYNEDLLRQRKTIRREEVKKETGMCYPIMTKLKNHGRLDIKSIINGRQQRFFVNQNSLNKLIEDRAIYINKFETALLLGITRDSVTHLINEKYLKEILTPYAVHTMILKNEAELLLIECTGSYDPNFQGISFHDALIKYSVLGLKIVDLIRFTKEGLIYPKTRRLDGTFVDVLYSEYELEKCSKKLKDERREVKGYYFTEIMKILHVGERKLKSLLIHEDIEPDETIELKDGRKRYLFNQEKIERIRRALNKN